VSSKGKLGTSTTIIRIEDKIKHGTPDIIAVSGRDYLFVECKLSKSSKCQQFQLRHLIEDNYQACFVFHEDGYLVIVFNKLLSKNEFVAVDVWSSLFNLSLCRYDGECKFLATEKGKLVVKTGTKALPHSEKFGISED